MKLSHRFKEIDKARIWLDHPYCQNCNSNQGLSLHHCYGAKGAHNDSIFNSACLCLPCHKKGDCENVHTTGNETRRNFLEYAMRMVFKAIENGSYTMKDRDIKFLESVQEDVEFIKDNM